MSSTRTDWLRPTVVNAVAFGLSFAAWVMLGPSAAAACRDLGLAPSLAPQLKALPILVGSVLRIPIGLLADRFGPRLLFPLVLLVGAAGAILASVASSAAGLIAGGAVLGLVGTSFAVGVLSVSSSTPANKQGAALGLFSVGNVGSALSAFLVPLLLQSFGWRVTLRLYAVVLVLTAVSYFVYFRREQRRAGALTLKALCAPLASFAVHRLGVAYMATFGAFVGTCLIAAEVLVASYGIAPVRAGLMASLFALTAGLMRYVGGRLADRLGARRVVVMACFGILATIVPLAALPVFPIAVALLVASGCAMGVGCAAVLRLVHERFPRNVGAVGGIVGAIGGLGGYAMPILSGALAGSVGSYRLSFLPIALLAVMTLVLERKARVQQSALVAAV